MLEQGVNMTTIWMVVGFVFMLGVSMGYIWGWVDREKDAFRWSEEQKPCPHGWEDWDDCPDCRH